jgi:hypothetical protein
MWGGEKREKKTDGFESCGVVTEEIAAAVCGGGEEGGGPGEAGGEPEVGWLLASDASDASGRGRVEGEKERVVNSCCRVGSKD